MLPFGLVNAITSSSHSLDLSFLGDARTARTAPARAARRRCSELQQAIAGQRVERLHPAARQHRQPAKLPRVDGGVLLGNHHRHDFGGEKGQPTPRQELQPPFFHTLVSLSLSPAAAGAGLAVDAGTEAAARAGLRFSVKPSRWVRNCHTNPAATSTQEK